jgi:hypothetical protein
VQPTSHPLWLINGRDLMTSAALLDDIAAFDWDEVRRARQFCFVVAPSGVRSGGISY